MARYSEAHNRAAQKYQNAHYYRTTVIIPKDMEDVIKEKAKNYGSVNAYINYLLNKDLEEGD